MSFDLTGSKGISGRIDSNPSSSSELSGLLSSGRRTGKEKSVS